MSSACAVASRRRTREQASSLCESHRPLCSVIQYNVFRSIYNTIIKSWSIMYYSVHIDNNVRVPQPAPTPLLSDTVQSTILFILTIMLESNRPLLLILDILHHLDHSDQSNHSDNPDWSVVNLEDNCRIRIVKLCTVRRIFIELWVQHIRTRQVREKRRLMPRLPNAASRNLKTSTKEKKGAWSPRRVNAVLRTH